MLLAARGGANQQRPGWAWPLLGFIGGWASYFMVQREDDLAKVIAVVLLAGWAWVCVQPSIRHKFDTIGGAWIDKPAINHITQYVQQGILFFSTPILLLSTQTEDAGQVMVTGLVMLAALLSAIDSVYDRFIAKFQLPFVGFHCLCCFVASLVLLPIVIPIPMEQSFNIALLIVVLWLVGGAPLSRRHNEISLRVFIVTLIFPLLAWSMKQHIPPTNILVERSVVTNRISEHEPVIALSVVSAPQLKNGIYLHAAIDAPLGMGAGIVFNWRHGNVSYETLATTVGDQAEGYRSYAYKKDFAPDALGQWTVDILTSDRQLLERVRFDVVPDPDYSSALTVPRAAFRTPRVTGLVIKPSM